MIHFHRGRGGSSHSQKKNPESEFQDVRHKCMCARDRETYITESFGEGVKESKEVSNRERERDREREGEREGVREQRSV